MITMLPVLLLRGRQNVLDHDPQPAADRRARIERLWLERPVTVTIITVVLTGLAFAQFPRIYFDYNLLNMQSDGLPAVVYEEKLIHSSTNSVLFAAVISTNLSQSSAWHQQITT